MKLLKVLKKDKFKDIEILNYLTKFNNKINNEYECDSFDNIIKYLSK
jgi:hypothetical protein